MIINSLNSFNDIANGINLSRRPSNASSLMEAMRVLQKGQIKFVSKGEQRAQNEALNKLFNLAA
jgi:hypothetical protein